MMHAKTIFKNNQVENINNCVFSVLETVFEMDELKRRFNEAGERIIKVEYLYKIFRITVIERNKNTKVELRVIEEIGNGGDKLLQEIMGDTFLELMKDTNF